MDSVISTVILDVYVSTMDLTVIGGLRPRAADLDRLLLVSPAQSATSTSAARTVFVRLLHSHFKQKSISRSITLRDFTFNLTDGKVILTPNHAYVKYGSGIRDLTQDTNTVYTHPSYKVCNYSYTHPAEKQCNFQGAQTRYIYNDNVTINKILDYNLGYTVRFGVAAMPNGITTDSVSAHPIVKATYSNIVVRVKFAYPNTNSYTASAYISDTNRSSSSSVNDTITNQECVLNLNSFSTTYLFGSVPSCIGNSDGMFNPYITVELYNGSSKVNYSWVSGDGVIASYHLVLSYVE